MLTRVLSFAVGFLATAACFFAYHAMLALYNRAFPMRYMDEPGLAVAILLVVVGIYILRRGRVAAGWLLTLGSLAFLVLCLHDCFLDYGMQYHWFQFGGDDAVVLQGFGEPRENPWIAVPAEIMRFVSLLIYAGIFWLSARVVHRHLTMRWSERRPALSPSAK
jgi:hypothetical protein